jgi:nicotinate-nucleotide pyrophosphorylase (carboxylating)
VTDERRPAAPPQALVRKLVEAALAEDRARDDVTTAALVPAGQVGRGLIIAKADGVLAGIDVARTAFEAVDPELAWTAHLGDGAPLRPGARVATVAGRLASVLRAERVALNFLTHLSGVATATAQAVEALAGTGCRLRDTRKTIPLLRRLQKYATAVGGAANHRMDLADGVLIKDNHLAAVRARGLTLADAVRLAREANPGMRVEVEVTDLEEAREAIEAGADELLLDNMSPGEMRKVAALAARRTPRPVLEASGGITAGALPAVAGTGVDYVSIGAITHSAPALDMSLEVEA